MPEASQPRISETVIRIPRMIGWPPRLPGSIVMISRYDAILLASPVYLVFDTNRLRVEQSLVKLTNDCTLENLEPKPHSNPSLLRLLLPLALQTATNLADSLPQTVFVFDQGQAEPAFAHLAEPTTGAHHHIGFVQQLHGKVN